MKKILSLFLLLFLVLYCYGCNNIVLNDYEVTIYEGDIYNIEPHESIASSEFTYKLDSSDLATINDNCISTKKSGILNISIVYNKDDSVSCNLKINILKIEIICDDVLTINQECLLKINCDKTVTWESSNPAVANISNGVLKGISEGEVNVIGHVNNMTITKSIVVKKPDATSINVNKKEIVIEENGYEEIEVVIEPNEASQTYQYEIDNKDIVAIENDNIKGLKEGKATITFYVNDNVKCELKVEVMASEKPIFECNENFKETVTIGYGKEFDVLTGIKVIDNVDGDITSKVEVSKPINNKRYGKQDVELKVQDKAGNVTTFTRSINVVWNYDVMFIGHAGCYYGLMNSEEAFLYAAEKLHYQALECDLKQTSDGVFVMSHDNDFNGYDIASNTWETLKNVEKTSSRNAGIPSQNGSVTKDSYTAKLCTLERYLDICKEYNIKAVIELKSSKGITNTDQSRMQALMDVIEEKGMRENVIFLGSQYNCLIWTRNNGYSDIECQYLVNSCENETYLNRCIEYDLDISINVTADPEYNNSEEWLARYHEAGLKVSTYTYTQYVDYDVVQKWIDKGVDYVTCDWHLIENLKLVEQSLVEKPQYQVTFKDVDGTILKVVNVKEGATAASPLDPVKNGYKFTGWDKSFRNVQSNLEINATYELINYEIIYNDNLDKITQTTWASKDEFTNELYTDIYNWFVDTYESLNGVSVENGKVTINLNGKVAIFSNMTELKAIDKYVFEQTVSNYMFKPVKRNSDGTCIIENSELYFFNSEKYKNKYQDMDQYLINCINTSYQSYDKTYTPTASGKIQIFFRFHQWVNGTNIVSLNTLPNKYIVEKDTRVNYVAPSTKLTYTIEDSFDLPTISTNVKFLGWYLDKECTKPITSIEKGSYGTLVLYAKWDL